LIRPLLFGDSTVKKYRLSASMNGTFKIGITKAKEDLMSAKEKRFMSAKFLPTDIIPIVNKAWSHSFANVAFGKKALAERGWNPLNRSLLKNKDVLDTKLDADANTEDALSILTAAAMAVSATGRAAIQVNEGKSADVIDLLVSDRDRAQQRQQVLDRKLLAANATATYERTKKLTSGKMVVSGKHRLSTHAMDQVTECVKFKVEQEEERQHNRVKKRRVLNNKVEKAKSMEESTWTTDQYKAMVQCYKLPDDPRMAKGIAGLKSQWMQRKGRSSPKYSQIKLNDDFPQLQLQDDDALLGFDDIDGDDEDATPDHAAI